MPRLSTLLICLAVVGIIAAVTWIATRSAHKPATGDIKPGAASDPDYGDGVTAWQRARSGVALVVLLAFVGALIALIVVVAGAVTITGLRTTVQ